MAKTSTPSSAPVAVPEFDPDATLGDLFGAKPSISDAPPKLPEQVAPSPAFVMVDADDAEAMSQMDIEQLLAQNTPANIPDDQSSDTRSPSMDDVNAAGGEFGSSPPAVSAPEPAPVIDGPPVIDEQEVFAKVGKSKAGKRAKSAPPSTPDQTSAVEPLVTAPIDTNILDGEILAPQQDSRANPKSGSPAKRAPKRGVYTSRIEIMDAWQYTGLVGDAPEWVDRNWVGYADQPDLIRDIPPGPCLRVPTYRGDVVVTRPGDYIVQQTMKSTDKDASGDQLRMEVWGREDFERLFVKE